MSGREEERPLASRTLGERNHLSVVREEATRGETRRIGPYELIRPVDHLGLPGLWFARREAPPFLAGPSVLLPVDRALAQLPGIQERVVRAARRAQAIRHPMLVRIEEVVATEDDLALVLEAVDGHSLRSLLRSSDTLAARFQADVVLELGARLLEALHDLHSLPRVDDAPGAHGHVSLNTVLFCPDGRVRVIGFGLPTATGTTPIHSRWNDRAPTRAEEKALDLPALGDQYAVGLVLLQLTTGQTLDSLIPREASLPERARAVEQLLGRLRLRDALTPPLLRLLAPNPAHRFADAAEAALALRHPRGPYAPDALEALVRKAVAEAGEPDGAAPEGTPVDLLPRRPTPVRAPEERTQRSPAQGSAEETWPEALGEDDQPSSEWDVTNDTEDALPAATAPDEPTEDPDGPDELPTEPAASAARRANGALGRGGPSVDPAAFDDTAPSAIGGPPKGLDLSRTEASDEAGMAVAVARAWAETDGTVPARRVDASGADVPLTYGPTGSPVDSHSDDSLDVWRAPYEHVDVSPLVEEDTGALSAEDLEEVAGDWFLDEDPSNVELDRTVPEVDEDGDEPRRPQVKPGRTVPYSPAFVPKSAAFPFQQKRAPPRPPELPPGALGLLSAAMPSVKRSDAERVLGAAARGVDDPENRTTEPGAEAPAYPAQARDEDDHTHPFGGERPTTESVADVAAPTAPPPLALPSSVPGDASPGPAWVMPSARGTGADTPAPGPVEGGSVTARGPVGDGGGTGLVPVVPRERDPDRPRRRRRRKGARSRRGQTATGLRSLPRLWEEQTIWSSSAVVRGVILGVFILLLIGLVEGVRRRFETAEPARTEVQQEAEQERDSLLE